MSSKKKDSLKPWLSRPAINRSVTLPLTRPLTQRLSNLNEFHPNELDPYLLFDARDSMIGTLENPTLDLDPSKPDTLNVITATRSSVATRTLPDGTIALAEQDTVRVDQTQGAELTPTKFQRVGYTDFSQDWTLEGSTLTESQTTAPDGTTPVYELTENTGTSRHRLFDSGIPLVVGQDYTVSAYVKKVSSGRFFLINSSALNGIKGFLNLDTGVATLTSGTGTIAATDEGDDWYRLSVTAEATSTNGFVYMQLQNAQTDVTYTGTGASMLIWGPQLEEGTTASSFVANTTGSPKFITGATYGPRVPMILVEPSATNLVSYSEDFSQSSWDKQSGGTGVAPAITSNDTIAPDGTQSADKVVFNKGAADDPSNYSILSDAFPSQQNTASLFIKADTHQRIVIRNSSNWVAYDVTTEWTRIEQTDTGGSLQIGLRDGYGVPNVPDTATVYIWGAQVEAGSVATSSVLGVDNLTHDGGRQIDGDHLAFEEHGFADIIHAFFNER